MKIVDNRSQKLRVLILCVQFDHKSPAPTTAPVIGGAAGVREGAVPA